MANQDAVEYAKDPIAQFSSRQAAEQACQTLRESGLPPSQISLVEQNLYPEIAPGKDKTKESVKGGAVAGALLGVVVALTISLLALNVANPPGHPLGIVVLTAVLGGLGGALAGSLIGAATGINVPTTEAVESDDRADLSENYVVVVEGTTAEVLHAKELLSQGS